MCCPHRATESRRGVASESSGEFSTQSMSQIRAPKNAIAHREEGKPPFGAPACVSSVDDEAVRVVERGLHVRRVGHALAGNVERRTVID